MKLLDQVNEYWQIISAVLVAVAAVVWIVAKLTMGGIAYDVVRDEASRNYLNTVIGEELAQVDIPSDEKIVSMDSGIAANTQKGAQLEKEIGIERDRLNAVGQVLMRPPPE